MPGAGLCAYYRRQTSTACIPRTMCVLELIEFCWLAFLHLNLPALRETTRGLFQHCPDTDLKPVDRLKCILPTTTENDATSTAHTVAFPDRVRCCCTERSRWSLADSHPTGNSHKECRIIVAISRRSAQIHSPAIRDDLSVSSWKSLPKPTDIASALTSAFSL